MNEYFPSRLIPSDILQKDLVAPEPAFVKPGSLNARDFRGAACFNVIEHNAWRLRAPRSFGFINTPKGHEGADKQDFSSVLRPNHEILARIVQVASKRRIDERDAVARIEINDL